MMAVNCTCSFSTHHQFPIQNKYGSSLILNYLNQELKSKRCYSVPLPLKRARAPVPRRRRRMMTMITASIRNKVYEDKSQGIVCYQDELGEIICEGYDEGPCFQRTPKPTSYHPRDAEITNVLIRQGWLQIVKGEESNETVLMKEDLNNCNGFNSFR